MNIYYIFDRDEKKRVNERGRNYWYSYITELLCRLGVTGRELPPSGCGVLSPGDVVFIGPGDASRIADSLLNDRLTVFAFGTEGCDGIFGITGGGEKVFQPDGEFSVAGWFYDSGKWAGKPLPVVSDIRKIKADKAETLAYIAIGDEIPADISENSPPGLTRFKNKYYFPFDLTQTLLTASQGKPVYGPRDGFALARVTNSRVTPQTHDRTIAFGDIYVYIIEAVLAAAGFPMLDRVPPLDNLTAPDITLFFGGDDDATDRDLNLGASLIMYERGLPYHINLMPDKDGNFVSTEGDAALIRSRGHKIGLHYDFASRPDEFSKEGFARQLGAYIAAFGELPAVNVGHCVISEGWSERLRWQSEMGIKGDNSRFSGGDVPGNINAFNVYGFVFGTAFPFFAYDDASHGNAKLNIAELPNCYYEPRLGEGDQEEKRRLHRRLDETAELRRPLNWFNHPHYICGWWKKDPDVGRALDEAMNYIVEKGWTLSALTPDDLCLFWHARSASRIEDIMIADGKISFTVTANCPLTVRIPVIDDLKVIRVNGVEVNTLYCKADGIGWNLIAVPEGRHYIEKEL